MTPEIKRLIGDVAAARTRYLDALGAPTFPQATFKPSPDEWSLLEITEHITLAEQIGINGIWKAVDAFRRGTPVWAGVAPHTGKSIEDFIGATWKEKEQAPPIAVPKWGGSIEYWIASLRNNHPLLKELGEHLVGIELNEVIYPHPISGPMDALQRLEFLRFHLDRHREQLRRVRADEKFPA